MQEPGTVTDRLTVVAPLMTLVLQDLRVPLDLHVEGRVRAADP